MALWLVVAAIGIPWLGALAVWLASRALRPRPDVPLPLRGSADHEYRFPLSRKRERGAGGEGSSRSPLPGGPGPHPPHGPAHDSLTETLDPATARVLNAIAVGFALAAGLGTLAFLPYATADAVIRLPAGPPYGDLTIVPDGLGAFMAAITTVVGALVVVFSVDYMRGEPQLGRYYGLVLLFIGSMSGLVLSGSLLLLFLFWEMVGFCSYALIAFYTGDRAALAGGMRALVITQLGGLGLLVGALVAWAQLGTLQIDALLTSAQSLPPGTLAVIAFGFLLAAIAKSAQVPMHTWLPGAMEAPTPISALIHAATMVNAGVYLLARFEPAFASVPGWSTTVMTVGLASALLGALLALVETDLKRALAFSTTSQLGLMVLAIGSGAVFAGQLHLLSHAIFKALLFLGAGAVIHAVGTRDMRLMGGLGRRMAFTRASFVVGALALAGLPIANGFWSKDLMLTEILATGPSWLATGLLVGSGLTALYAVRTLWLVFYGAPRSELPAHDAGPAMRLALGPLAAGALLSWLLVGPLGGLLAIGGPASGHHTPSTLALVSEVATSPATLLSLAVAAAGLAGWWWRARLAGPVQALRPAARALEAGAGFEWLNVKIADGARGLAAALAHTQTGQIGWNVVGIVGMLIVLLALLAREV